MTAPATYRELVDGGVKLVILDTQIAGVPDPQITGDNYKAGYLGAQHLFQLGHRRIAYLGISRITTVGKERLKGVNRAFAEARIAVDTNLFREIDFSEASAEKCAFELLAAKDRPSALLVRHDVAARGAMRAVYAAGLSIPKDISIVGNGDVLGSDMFRVPLTTVRFPTKQMADLCVHKLLDMLSGKAVKPGTTVLDVALVVRESTAPPR